MTAGTLGIAAAGGVAGAVTGEILDNPTEDLLRKILNQLVAMNHYAEIQRTRTMYPLLFTPSQPTRNLRNQVRVDMLIVSGSPGDTLVLQQGTAPLHRWVGVSGDPVSFVLPLLLAGDITIVDETDPSSTEWMATLFYHEDSGIGISTTLER